MKQEGSLSSTREAFVKKVGFKPGVKTEAVMDEIDEMSRQKKIDNLTCARRYESLHWNGSSWQNESAGSLPSAEKTLRLQPGIKRVQALADISRSALCCQINETRAPTENRPNTAQL